MNDFLAIMIIGSGVLFLLYAICVEIKSAKKQRDCKHKNQHRYSNLRVCLDCGRKSYGTIE